MSNPKAPVGVTPSEGEAGDAESEIDAEHRHEHHDHGVRKPALQFGERAFARAAALFRAAGDVPRLRLLAQLAQGEWCVTELAEALKEGLPVISQRLRILRAEGLVQRRRQGKHIYYALADQHVAELLQNALAHAEEHHHPSSVDGDRTHNDE